MTIRIFIDGACQPNPGHKGLGIVIEWQGKNPTIISKYAGEGTNNEAEYEAFIESLQAIKEENIKEVIVHSDSNLMVQQVNGNWQCRDLKLKPLLFKAQKRIEWLKNNNYNVELIYIPRELNLADTPAKNGCKKREA